MNEETGLFREADAAGSLSGRDRDVAQWWYDPDASPLGVSNACEALQKMTELMDIGHKAAPPARTASVPP